MNIDTEVQPVHSHEKRVEDAAFWIIESIIIPAMLIVWYGTLALMFKVPGNERIRQAAISIAVWLCARLH
jgi:hypothetical protein